MRTPTPFENAARCAVALLDKLRRGLQAYLVLSNAGSERQHERLYRDAIGYTIATHQRRSIRRPATDQFAPPGAAANAPSTSTDIRAPAEDTQTAEPGSRLNDGSKPLTSGWNQALGTSGPDNATAGDIRPIPYRRQRPADPTREPGALSGPAASAQDGELVPRLRWLLTESARTIATSPTNSRRAPPRSTTTPARSCRTTSSPSTTNSPTVELLSASSRLGCRD